MMPTDRLFLLDPAGRRFLDAVWNGPWPPPERLVVMRGEKSGHVAIFEEDKAPDAVLAMARMLGTITETRFRLRNASRMPEPANEGEHWFRGAEYVPETDDA